jgi:intraflagellar transport protein 81
LYRFQLKRDTETTTEHIQNLFSTILQIENIHNKEVMLQAAHRLRLEREREKSLANQKQEQQASLKHTEQRIQRLQQQLKEIRQAAMGATPEGYFLQLLHVNTLHIFSYCFQVLRSA